MDYDLNSIFFVFMIDKIHVSFVNKKITAIIAKIMKLFYDIIPTKKSITFCKQIYIKIQNSQFDVQNKNQSVSIYHL